MTAFMTVAALVLVMYTAMVDMAMVSTCTANYEVIETDYNTADCNLELYRWPVDACRAFSSFFLC